MSSLEQAAATFASQASSLNPEIRAIGIWALFASSLGTNAEAKAYASGGNLSEVEQIEMDFAMRSWRAHRAARFGLVAFRAETSQAMACDLLG